MPNPRPLSFDSRTPDGASEHQMVANGDDSMVWAGAAALMDLPDEASAAAEALSEAVPPANEAASPATDSSEDSPETSANTGSHGSVSFEQSDAGTPDDDFSLAASSLPLWYLMGDDGILSPADLSFPFSIASAYDAFQWGGHFFPSAGSDLGLGGSQFAPAADLILLDMTSYARPEKAGKGGGKGGNKDSSDSNDPGALSDYLSGDPGDYNILIDFKGSWTSTLQDAFTDAAELISDIILGDIADVFFRGTTIDDIKIKAELVEIDGAGGILGQAGPTAIRTANFLPAAGMMEIDSADAEAYVALGLWDEIVLHEMLHTIGFGSVWDYKGLVAGSGTADPTFTGTQATLAYRSLFDADDATGVPLEQDGGPGTIESHWDEETFGAEIMTGYLDFAGNYLSDVTVASLTDLGYETTQIAALV